ncbi:MAG TPA: anti-sigma factor [Sphingomicrobium sp.]|nr:anti-sigma factor [Sphingomicrobium sp.]
MSDDHTTSGAPNELAGEYALGVLTGGDLERARELAKSDPQFRVEVARWSGCLAPLLDSVPPADPPAAAWDRIERRLGGQANGNNVIQLRRRVYQWRGIAAAMSGLAACLALVLVADIRPPAPVPAQIEQSPAQPLVAMLGDQQTKVKVVASWDPAARQLVLAVPGEMPSDAQHSHELWVIPAGGKPRSLGTMSAGKQMHMRLADALAQLLRQGATIAVSVEPRGGSPTGAPTGPVVASGVLSQA